MAVKQNRVLRDQRNAVIDEFIKLNEQYGTLREDVLSGDTQRAAAALPALEALRPQLAALSLQLRNIQVENSTGNDFDPQLARQLEKDVDNVIDIQNGTYLSVSLATKAERALTAENTTQSAGQEVKQSGDAGVTNPAPPTQTFTSPDAATTATQPDPVVAESNSNTPAIGVTASPSPDATASVVQTNTEEAVPQSSPTPGANSVATRERSRTQSYVFYATTVTSEFRQGRFEQTLEGSLYIFPRPKTAQVVDPPVKAADLGSQSFGLTDNPRVNPGKKKVASAQDTRKATITPVVPTNVQFTGQASNLSNPDGMDFSAISGFGA